MVQLCTLSKRKGAEKSRRERSRPSRTPFTRPGCPGKRSHLRSEFTARVRTRERHPSRSRCRASFFRTYAPFSIFGIGFSDLFYASVGRFSGSETSRIRITPTPPIPTPNNFDPDEKRRLLYLTPACSNSTGSFAKDEVVFSISRRGRVLPAKRRRASGVLHRSLRS